MSSVLKEFAVKLGLDVDALSFAKGQFAVTGLQYTLSMIRGAVGGLGEAIFGFNSKVESTQLKLAAIAQMNLKLPWEEAKAAAAELYAGLQKDAAETPAETGELVDFAAQISNAFFSAGKNMKDLRKFTTDAVVAAKVLNMQGIAALDIQQALGQHVGIRDRFAKAVIEGAGSTLAKFNALGKAAKVEFLTGAFGGSWVQNARKEFEGNWAGVTSTLSDNSKMIAGQAGKPIFDVVKTGLKDFGDWVQKNAPTITKFFLGFVTVLFAVGRVLKAVAGFIGMFIEYAYKAGPVLGTLTVILSAITVAMMIFGAVSTAAALQSAAAWVLAALPVIAIVALVGIALLLIEDIYTGLTGGKSVIFELWGAWKRFMSSWLEDKDSDPWWLSMVKMLLRFIFDTEGAWNRVVDAWKTIFSDFAEWVGNLFAQLWEGIKSGVSSAVSYALNALNPFASHSSSTETLSTSSYTPRSPSIYSVSPSMHIGALTVQTTGDPADVTSKIRKTIEEHHETVMRITRAALAGAR